MVRTADTAPHRSPVGSIVLLVIGVLLTGIGLSVAAAGSTAAVVAARQQESGYFTTPTALFSTNTYAVTTPRTTSFSGGEGAPTMPFDIGEIRILAAGQGEQPLFIGIARQSDLDQYLADVRHAEVTDVEYGPFRAQYRDVPGSTAPSNPTRETFWVAQAAGSGLQQLTWTIQPGNWAVVLMNADGSAGVSAKVQGGFRSDLLAPIALGIVLSGILGFLIGVPLVLVGANGIGRSMRRDAGAGAPADSSAGGSGAARAASPPPGAMAPGPPDGGTMGAPPSDGGTIATGPTDGGTIAAPPLDAGVRTTALPDRPVRLIGHRDLHVSRALWLVKWLLAVPHYLLLLGLWIAFVVSTIASGLVVLFTGRYPRSLFEFNVGVLRWNWRVGFYAYAALGTDRYPPFTLAHTDYPADLEVDYPEHLNNGLVLVKSWLLAIPHYLVLAALAGGFTFWPAFWPGPWSVFRPFGGGMGTISVLGALVLIAAVILLFTGRYQRGIFDLVVGINRWVYRVAAYASLMRDEYPPFRLDQGEDEPKPVAPDPSEASALI
jgi:hypothetical protein